MDADEFARSAAMIFSRVKPHRPLDQQRVGSTHRHHRHTGRVHRRVEVDDIDAALLEQARCLLGTGDSRFDIAAAIAQRINEMGDVDPVPTPTIIRFT